MFTGYCNQTIDFLWGIRFNNERPWFEAHKGEYLQYVLQPTRELGEELYDYMAGKYPELWLNLHVSRIYRDARRLFGRGPYKDHLWLSIHQPAEAPGSLPTFWFELTPEGYSYGMGFWEAPAGVMARLRARMDRDPAPMEKLARRLNRQRQFALEGTDYKRPAAAPSGLLQPWYSKRNFVLIHEAAHEDLLWSRELADVLTEGFEFLLPYYEYILAVSGDPDPRSPEA